MDEILPIYQPSFTEIRSTIREKKTYNIFSKVVSSWPWPLIYVPEIYITSSLVKDYQPAKFEDDGMINDREIAE